MMQSMDDHGPAPGSKRAREEEDGDEQGALLLPYRPDFGDPCQDTSAASDHVSAWACSIIGAGTTVEALRAMCDAWRVDMYMECGRELDAFELVRLHFGECLRVPPTQRLEATGARARGWLLALSGMNFHAAAHHGGVDEELQRRCVALVTLISNVGLAAQVQASISRGDDCPELRDADEGSAGARQFNERMGATRVLDPSEMTSTERYVRALFAKTHDKAYALGRDGEVLKQVFLEDGTPTHAWEAVTVLDGEQMSVEQMINEFSISDIDGCGEGSCHSLLMKSYLTNTKSAAIELSKGLDWRFPRLIRARGVFSFRDCIYIAHLGETRDLVLPYGDRRIKPLLGRKIAAKFFDMPLLPLLRDDWQSMETPAIEIVMNHQGWSDAEKQLMYVMIGRMMCDVGQLDTWQLFSYLLGEAGTGKSLLSEFAVGQIYNQQDIGILSTNSEKRFGLGALLGKLIVLGPELSSGMEFSQMEVQQMASGEHMKINIKNRTGRDAKWTAPLWLAGNSLPDWVDQSGSMVRRFVPFSFLVSVTEEDKRRHPNMEEMLKGDMAALIVKSFRAYLARVQSDGSSLKLPESVARTSREVVGSSTSLVQMFADEDRIQRGQGLKCRWSELRAALQAYEKSMKITPSQCVSSKMSNSFFVGLFLKQVGCRKEGPDVLGCCIREEGFSFVVEGL